MEEIIVPNEYLLILESLFLTLHYVLPHKSISYFLFACLRSSYADLNCGLDSLDLLFWLDRNVSAALVLFHSYCTDEVFFLIYSMSIFIPVNFAYICHEKNRWMIVNSIDFVAKNLSQLADILSTEASSSGEQPTDETSAPKVAPAGNPHSEKKLVDQTGEAKLEVESSKDSTLSGENSREGTNDRSNGASEEASASDKGEDQKTRTVSETSSSESLEKERIKWAEEREKLEAQLDSTIANLRRTFHTKERNFAMYLQEKRIWEREKRELAGELEKAAVISKLLAYYKHRCLALTLRLQKNDYERFLWEQNAALDPGTHRSADSTANYNNIEDFWGVLD